MTTARQITTEARRYVAAGTPHVHQGEDIERGADCIGLLYSVARATGCIPLDAYKPIYGRIPSGGLLEAGIAQWSDLIWKRDLENDPMLPLELCREADVVLMAWKRVPMHCGFLAVDPEPNSDRIMLIHSFAEVAKCVEHGLNLQWQRKITHLFRLRGLE